MHQKDILSLGGVEAAGLFAVEMLSAAQRTQRVSTALSFRKEDEVVLNQI